MESPQIEVSDQILDEAVRAWARENYAEFFVRVKAERIVAKMFPNVSHRSEEFRSHQIKIIDMIRERRRFNESQPQVQQLTQPYSQQSTVSNVNDEKTLEVDEAVSKSVVEEEKREETKRIFRKSFHMKDTDESSDSWTYSPRQNQTTTPRVITPRRQTVWGGLSVTPTVTGLNRNPPPKREVEQSQSEAQSTELVSDIMEHITEIFGADVDSVERSQTPAAYIVPVSTSVETGPELLLDDDSAEIPFPESYLSKEEVVTADQPVGDTDLMEIISQNTTVDPTDPVTPLVVIKSPPLVEAASIQEVSQIVQSPIAERVFLLSDDSDFDDEEEPIHQVSVERGSEVVTQTVRDLSQVEVVQAEDTTNNQIIPTPPVPERRSEDSYITLIERFSTLAVRFESLDSIAWIQNAIQSGLQTPGRKLYFARQIITFLEAQNESLPLLDRRSFDERYQWIPAVDFNSTSVFYPMDPLGATFFEEVNYNLDAFNSDNPDFISQNTEADTVLAPNFERLISFLELQQETAFRGRFDADLVEELYTLSEGSQTLRDKRHALSTLIRASGIVQESIVRRMRVRYPDQTAFNAEVYTYTRTKQKAAVAEIRRTMLGRFGTEPGFLMNALALWIMLPSWANRPAAVWAGVIMQVIKYTDGFGAFIFDSSTLEQIDAGANVLTQFYLGIERSISNVSERIQVDTFRRTIIDPLDRTQQVALVTDYLVWTVPAAVDYITQQGLTPTRQQLISLYTTRDHSLSTEPFHLTIAGAPFPDEINPILNAAEQQGLVTVSRATFDFDSPEDVFNFVIVQHSGNSVSASVIPDEAVNDDVTLSPMILN